MNLVLMAAGVAAIRHRSWLFRRLATVPRAEWLLLFPALLLALAAAISSGEAARLHGYAALDPAAQPKAGARVAIQGTVDTAMPADPNGWVVWRDLGRSPWSGDPLLRLRSERGSVRISSSDYEVRHWPMELGAREVQYLKRGSPVAVIGRALDQRGEELQVEPEIVGGGDWDHLSASLAQEAALVFALSLGSLVHGMLWLGLCIAAVKSGRSPGVKQQ